MKLLADESVDHPIVRELQAEGFSIVSIAEVCPGVSDDVVLNKANNAGALLLTGDKDFGELVFRQGRIHNGVVLIRLEGLSATKKAITVLEALRSHADELASAFTVISPAIVRIRRSF